MQVSNTDFLDMNGGTAMADHITIRKAPGTWTVRAGGAVLGESDNALELSEGDYPFVIYFPRGDIAMAFLVLRVTPHICCVSLLSLAACCFAAHSTSLDNVRNTAKLYSV